MEHLKDDNEFGGKHTTSQIALVSFNSHRRYTERTWFFRETNLQVSALRVNRCFKQHRDLFARKGYVAISKIAAN